MALAPNLRAPLEFFPMSEMRDKQRSSLEFLQRALDKGYKDIVISAPTGMGKSAIGAAVCFWAAQDALQLDTNELEAGGYYLVTQKMLQDQLAGDVRDYDPRLRDLSSLKSAVEYKCTTYNDCLAGKRVTGLRRCSQLVNNTCPYRTAKFQFMGAALSVTNYPYFFAERAFVQQFKKRRVLVADECHSLEGQLLKFVELTVNEQTVDQYTPMLKLPELDTLLRFHKWVLNDYLPPLEARRAMLKEQLLMAPENRQGHGELNLIENYINRCTEATNSIKANPENWVYWQERDQRGYWVSTAKPIAAAPFMQHLITDAADIRVYLSAYPGPKDVFCSALGLDEERVAYASYSSTFDPARRPVHMTMVGPMSRQYLEQTTPLLLKQIARIAGNHANEKGIVHTHSYKLGKIVYDYMVKEGFGDRVLFPEDSRERNTAFQVHALSSSASIMISPSMTEGFNLIDDLARWQVIAKCPFPYLGDKQVQAKKEANPDWYILQTCMTIIQACGRVMRSPEDFGSTYILDRDFERLFKQNKHFFPKWFADAFHWYD